MQNFLPQYQWVRLSITLQAYLDSLLSYPKLRSFSWIKDVRGSCCQFRFFEKVYFSGLGGSHTLQCQIKISNTVAKAISKYRNIVSLTGRIFASRLWAVLCFRWPSGGSITRLLAPATVFSIFIMDFDIMTIIC